MRYWQFLFISIFSVSWLMLASGVASGQNPVAPFFPKRPNAQALQSKYKNGKIKILIVPGHDNETPGGGRFKNIKEADLNVELALEIVRIIGNDPKFEAILSRDKNGYQRGFADYFANNRDKILAFKRRVTNVAEDLFKRGLFTKKVIVDHVSISEKDAVKLYGINSWANEERVDVVLHIHFNDYPRKARSRPGKYSGFAIYVPESQLPNHDSSKKLAEAIFKKLKESFSVSNYPKEKIGIIEDQELIAIGVHGSLRSAALLIEYGYIYELQLVEPKRRAAAFKKMAILTYRGIKNYFWQN